MTTSVSGTGAGVRARNTSTPSTLRDACPPLPGAIYVAVRRIGNLRTVTAMGRFSPFWDGTSSELAGVDADEIHVHLLARDNAAANAVLNDLQAAFVETRQAVSLAA